MAATKFSVIWETTEGITTSELPGEYSYKIALNVAKALMQEVEREDTPLRL